jgi:tetratricopeptide (TPR) repeat protein
MSTIWKEIVRQALGIILLLLLIGVAAVVLLRPDHNSDCDQWADLDRSIRGCTQIINRGKRESRKDIAIAHYNRGTAYDNKGQYDRAIADYDKASQLNPRDADVYLNRGNAYANKGQYDRAIADYDKAIELNPRDADAYNNRGLAYYKKGDRDKAITDYRKALQIDPKHKRAKASLKTLGIVTGR